MKRQKKECTQQLKMLREALRAQGIDPSQIIKNFNREQKRKLRAIREDQADIKKARKKKYGKNYTLKTMRGEYVTSKSEMMIADTLFRNGISYEYEMEIKIGNVVLHPDFVIFINGMVFFWEHCGMMDDPFYRDSWHSRRKLYEDNGIIEGVNLIITTETRERMLTQEAINNIISTYFRIKPV